MSWSTSDRSKRLPPNWDRIASSILRRDGHQCKLRYRDICLSRATTVDHIIAGDNHNPSNLQAACTSCHAHKSSKEGAEARWGRRFRPPEAHPGVL